MLIGTSNGSGILIQHYKGLDPSSLVDLMIKKFTDDEVASGYKRTTTVSSRKLVDGIKLMGQLARTEQPGKSRTREVLTYGNRDGGYHIVVFTEKEALEKDQKLFDMFWKCLRFLQLPETTDK